MKFLGKCLWKCKLQIEELYEMNFLRLVRVTFELVNSYSLDHAGTGQQYAIYRHAWLQALCCTTHVSQYYLTSFVQASVFLKNRAIDLPLRHLLIFSAYGIKTFD